MNFMELVSETALFGPMLILMLLTFIVGVYMYRVRVAAARAQRMHPEKFKRIETTSLLGEEACYPADNFKNLFELPVIFYALCLGLMVTGLVDQIQVWLAWLFVVSRVAHSLVQCTYNKVMTRMRIYLLGYFTLMAMTIEASLNFFF